MCLQKVKAGILKVNDENSRIRIQDPDPNPDPLVRGMDPRIRIRIHAKMSWIRNTAFDLAIKTNIYCFSQLLQQTLSQRLKTRLEKSVALML